MTPAVYQYAHSAHVVANETCPTGSSSTTGLAFYPETGGTFPAAYRGGLFFTDHSRNCIWWMAKGTNGQPDPATRAVFLAPAANPVDLEIGPDGALYYADFDTNSIRRVMYSSNEPPTAVANADPTSGPAPLTVDFDGTDSSDPEGAALEYAWDLDGDGAYDNSTSPTPTRVYNSQASVTVRLRVTDPADLTDTDTVQISVANTPPVPAIQTPTNGTKAGAGQQVTFSGSASDAQDGNLAASRLSWTLRIQHCPDSCHAHDIETFPGVASGSFVAPDHEYPSHLELILTATDSNGVSSSVTRQIDYRTVPLTFQSVPSGLSLTVNGTASTTPFTRTVIQGSANSVSATTPQTLGSKSYDFTSWSDSGAATHTITAGTAAATYTATYVHPDTDAPTGSISIAGGRAFTASRSVTLTVPATDAGSGLSQVALSNDGTNWTTRPYAAFAGLDPAGHERHPHGLRQVEGRGRQLVGGQDRHDRARHGRPDGHRPRVAAWSPRPTSLPAGSPCACPGRAPTPPAGSPATSCSRARRRSVDDGLDDAYQPDRRPLLAASCTRPLPRARGRQGGQRRGVGLRHALLAVALQRVQQRHHLQRALDDRFGPAAFWGGAAKRSGRPARERRSPSPVGPSPGSRRRPETGHGEVFVDGAKVTTINLYTAAYQKRRLGGELRPRPRGR